MAEAQKIRLQILYGTKTEWETGILSELKLKTGELGVDYETPQLKVGYSDDESTGKTWAELPNLSTLSYYQNGTWNKTNNELVYVAQHSSGDNNYNLNINLPMGTGAEQIAWGNHTHKTLSVSSDNRDWTVIIKDNIVSAYYPSASITLQNGETSGLTIKYNEAYGVQFINNGEEVSTTWALTNSNNSELPVDMSAPTYHIATIEEVLPMPEIKFCSLKYTGETRDVTVTNSKGETKTLLNQKVYHLTFKVTKGQINYDTDRIELCTTTMSKHFGDAQRRYRKRQQWYHNLAADMNVDNSFSIEILDYQLYKCRRAGQAKLTSTNTVYYYRYPVYCRICRTIDNNRGNLHSNEISLNIHRNSQGVFSLR